MEDVEYLNDALLTVTSSHALDEVSFFSDRTSLRDIEAFSDFVKACERSVRHCAEYTAFKAQLMDKGLNRCQMLGHIESDGDDGVDIEMHHGPLLTLFDYCAIIIDALLARGEKVDSLLITRLVMDEHWADHVQVVMLSKTVHELINTGKIFLHFNQATGNVNEFLKKYRDGITPDRAEKINHYIDLCEQFESSDSGLLEVKNTITNWDYDVAYERMKKEQG